MIHSHTHPHTQNVSEINISHTDTHTIHTSTHTLHRHTHTTQTQTTHQTQTHTQNTAYTPKEKNAHTPNIHFRGTVGHINLHTHVANLMFAEIYVESLKLLYVTASH